MSIEKSPTRSQKKRKASSNPAIFIRDPLSTPETLHVIGEVDIANIPQMERVVEEMIEKNREIAIDLTACTYLDTKLIHCLENASTKAGVTVVAPSNGRVQRTSATRDRSAFRPVRFEPECR